MVMNPLEKGDEKTDRELAEWETKEEDAFNSSLQTNEYLVCLMMVRVVSSCNEMVSTRDLLRTNQTNVWYFVFPELCVAYSGIYGC